MNINIRPATIHDSNAIANILTTSVKTLGRLDYSNEQIEIIVNLHNAQSYLEEIETGKIIAFVAEAETIIVGFGSISPDGRAIGDLYVLPNYTRQGIGTLLLTTLERVALQKGVSKLWVMASLTGRSFYSSCGFQSEKDAALIDSETGIRVPCVDMTKVLSRNRDFQGKNHGDYGDLSTLTVPQFIRLGAKILWGS